MPRFNYSGRVNGRTVSGLTGLVADRAMAAASLQRAGIAVSMLTEVEPAPPKTQSATGEPDWDSPASAPPAGLRLWIGDIEGAGGGLRHLEAMGVRVGQWDKKRGLFENCYADEAAMAKLNEWWGVYVWGTYGTREDSN